MNKISNFFKWMIKYFYWISLAVFGAIYLRWFRLTPLVFEYYNDPNGAYIVGLILLGLYSVSAFTLYLFRYRKFLRWLPYASSTLLLVWNIAHVIAFFPSLELTTRCNGYTYYITWMHPIGDYQWTFDEFTVWEGINYESHFFGYSQGPFRIVCDEEKKVANVIREMNDVLSYSHGENTTGFDDYAGTQLNGYRYFLSFKCNNWYDYTCESETYTLYECGLDYKSCDSLPIRYTGKNIIFLTLESDELADTVNLYEEAVLTDEKIMIFTWGKNPKCYVEGCEILEQK